MSNTVTAMSNEELTAMLAQLAEQNKALQAQLLKAQQPKKKASRIIKITEKGGLYITDSKFICHSDAKQKDYQGGINIQGYQIQMFLTMLQDSSFVKQVVEVAQTGKEYRA